MARWDEAAAALGLPEMLLMENAAREALRVLEEESGPLRGKRVLLYMGAGKNGGDAACLARHVSGRGASPLVLHTRPLRSYRGATARHLRLARACGVPFVPVPPSSSRRAAFLNEADIVVDGLLGTGFSGQLRKDTLALVEEMNGRASRVFLLALDIPSGLDPLYGVPRPTAVRARVTVCFEAAKPGTVLPAAAPFTGRLRVRSIGLPPAVQDAAPASFRLLDASCAGFLPVARQGAHKGDFGRVCIVGGSPGLTGAAHLAALGALRTGCGLVSAAAPGGLCAEIKAGLPELITLPLGSGTSWKEAAAPGGPENALDVLRADALVVGPGMGRDPGAGDFLAALLRLPGRPSCVLDADALALLAEGAAPLDALREDDILTPHPGEAGRLLGIGAGRVQEDRFAAVRALCALCPALWILKGAGTLLGRRGQPVIISPHDVPSLAVGGAGDVLAGCLGGLLGQGCTSPEAAAIGVLLHVRAGEILARSFPDRGNGAGEIADALPEAKALLRAQAEYPEHIASPASTGKPVEKREAAQDENRAEPFPGRLRESGGRRAPRD
jgi:NAD(P)H-hydrate epimerase